MARATTTDVGDRLPEEVLHRPSPATTSVGVLVFSGSSGRVEADRARVLAGLGATALTYRWFGDGGQPAGLCEYPLESFAPAVARLAAECDEIVLLGTSKSARIPVERFFGDVLLVAGGDDRV